MRTAVSKNSRKLAEQKNFKILFSNNVKKMDNRNIFDQILMDEEDTKQEFQVSVSAKFERKKNKFFKLKSRVVKLKNES